MPVDIARLQTMATIEDPIGGISEHFVEVSLRSGSTLGVLSVPTHASAATGWVVSHSFGPEHLNLSALDVALARRIASCGAPTLRFHCQGYGDSEHTDFAPSIESHVEDTIDATQALRALTGVRSIGLVGTNFGASCALLAGQQASADHLVLIAPAVQGVRFLRGLVRAGAIIDLTESSGPDDTPEAWSSLKTGGSISVRGSVITGDDYRAFAEMDLRTTSGFTGTALVVQVSAGTEPRRDLSELSDRLESEGARVTRATITDRSAALLGERHFRPVDSDLLGDIASELHTKITDLVTAWSTDPGSPGTA